MKETKDKRVIFPYSYTTLKAFVDFLYLGAQEFLNKAPDIQDFSVFELLDLAHTYQVPLLFECCLRLINDSARFNDLNDIKAAAEKYKHKDLIRIVSSLPKSIQ